MATIPVIIDAKGAKSGGKEVENAFAGIKNSAKDANSGVSGLSSGLLSLKGAIAGLGIASAVIGFKQLITNTIESNARLSDLAIKVGTTASALSALGNTAQLSGSNLETLSDGLRFLNRNLAEAIQGSSEQAKAFNELGLSAKKLAATDSATAFKAVASALENVKSISERTRLEMALFGRSGAELNQTLSEIAKGNIAAATTTDEFAKKAKELDDKFVLLDKNSKRASVTLTSSLFPVIEGGIDLMNKFTLSIAQAINNLVTLAKTNVPNKFFPDGTRSLNPSFSKFSNTGNLLQNAVDHLPQSSTAQLTLSKAANSPIAALPKPSDFAGTNALKSNLDEISKKSKSATDELKKMTQELEAQADGVGKSDTEVLKYRISVGDLSEKFKVAGSEADKFKEKLIKASELKEAREKLQKTSDDLSQIFEDGFFAAMENGFDGLLEYFGKTLMQMIVKAQAANLAQYITGMPTSSANAGGLQGIVNGFLGGSSGGIGGLLSGFFGGGPGSYSSVAAPIIDLNFPGYASGGILGKGISIVGENGPELLYSRNGGQRIDPNMSMGGRQAQPVNIQVINQSRQPLDARTEQTFDINGLVTKVILTDLRKGGPVSSSLQGNFGLKRTGQG